MVFFSILESCLFIAFSLFPSPFFCTAMLFSSIIPSLPPFLVHFVSRLRPRKTLNINYIWEIKVLHWFNSQWCWTNQVQSIHREYSLMLFNFLSYSTFFLYLSIYLLILSFYFQSLQKILFRCHAPTYTCL